MSTIADLAAFVDAVRYDDLPPAVVDATKRRLFDALAVAYGAPETDALAGVRAAVAAEGGDACTLWATGGERAGPAGAAFFGATRTRALDYADAFLAPGGPTHPSDAVAACVATAEYARADGDALLASVAAAYEVHAELAWNAPARERGWDPATYTAVAAAAGAGVVLGLTESEARDAVSLAAADHGALAVDDRDWPALAGACAARAGVESALLAANGVDGPRDPFADHPVFGVLDETDAAAGDAAAEAEGDDACEHADDDGVGHLYAEDDTGFALDPACERVHDAAAKRYAVPLAAQSAVSVAVDLARRLDADPADLARVDLQTFDPLTFPAPAFDRPADPPRDAASSLPDAIAVALCDAEFGPAQRAPGRTADADVARLRDAVTVAESDHLTVQFDAGLMPAVLEVELDDGTVHHAEAGAFPGHPTQPMGWDALREKAALLLGADAAADAADACRDAARGDVDALLAAFA